MWKMDDTGIKKFTRVRNKPIQKWTKSDTNRLLNLLKECGRDSFEKPTAQAFYSRLIDENPALKMYTWKSARDKMRNLKLKYKAAMEWRTNTPTGLDEDDASAMQQKTLEICPYFDVLEEIYSPSINLSGQTETEQEDYSVYLNSEDEKPADVSWETRMEVSSTATESAAPLRKRSRIMPTSNISIKLLSEVQHDRLQYYEKKLEIDKEKEQRSFDLMEKGQAIERMKIEVEKEKVVLEKERVHGELKLKEKEMDINMALQKDRLRQEYELKKLELQLKYRTVKCEICK